MKLNDDLYISTKKLGICSEMLLARRLQDSSLTVSQCYLVDFISRCHPDGTFAKDLHRELGLSKASISENIKHLRTKGFLVLDPCQEDNRQKRLLLTDRARAEVQEFSLVIKQTEEAIYGSLSEPEQATLRQLTHKALANALELVKTG